MSAQEQPITSNFTSYPTPDPNPNPPPSHTDASLDPHMQGSQDESANPNFELVAAATDSATHENVNVTTNGTANVVLETQAPPVFFRLFHCEECNVTCDTKDQLEIHKQGKRHLKSLKKLSSSASANAPNMVLPPIASELENKKQWLSQNRATPDAFVHCAICNVACNNPEVFQTHIAGKKHSAKLILQQASMSGVFGATSDSGGSLQKKPVAFECELCKIFCTSSELLDRHIAGKKHMKKLEESGQVPNLSVTTIVSQDTPPTEPMVNPESKLEESGQEPNLPVTAVPSQGTPLTELMVNPESKFEESGQVQNLSVTAIASQDAPPTEPMVNIVPAMGKTVNSHVAMLACELCGITCNTKEMFNNHLGGKKHRKNLEKSERLIGPTPAPTTEPAANAVVIGPVQEEGKNLNSCGNGIKGKGKRGGGGEDLETKRQRVVESGVRLDAVQTCNLCNVVCNSPQVFISHLASQKHVAMAVKQAVSQAIASQAMAADVQGS